MRNPTGNCELSAEWVLIKLWRSNVLVASMVSDKSELGQMIPLSIFFIIFKNTLEFFGGGVSPTGNRFVSFVNARGLVVRSGLGTKGFAPSPLPFPFCFRMVVLVSFVGLK